MNDTVISSTTSPEGLAFLYYFGIILTSIGSFGTIANLFILTLYRLDAQLRGSDGFHMIAMLAVFDMMGSIAYVTQGAYNVYHFVRCSAWFHERRN